MQTAEQKRAEWKRKGFYIMTEPYFTFAYQNRTAWWWKVFDIKNTTHEDAVLLSWSAQEGYRSESSAIDSAIEFIETQLLSK